MKKLNLFLTSLAVTAASSALLVSCGESEKPSAETFAISSVTFANAELGEMYKPDLSGVKVVGSNGSSSDLSVTVKDNKYTRPDGTTGTLLAGQFKADQLGNYTLVLTTSSENVSEVTVTITAEDTTAPVISPANIADLPKTALRGETVQIPSLFTAKDAGKLEGEVKVKVLAPDQSEISFSAEHTFKPTVEGNYTIVATQKDESGNEGKYTAQFKVYAADFDPAVTAYLSSEYGLEQLKAAPGHEDYTKISFVQDVTAGENGIPAAPNGVKSATRVVGNNVPNFKAYVGIDFAQKDLSDCDYIGMWVYNAGNNISLLNPAAWNNGGGQILIQNIPAHSWYFWSYNVQNSSATFSGFDNITYSKDDVERFAFVIQSGDAANTDMYFTDMVLGNYEDGDAAGFTENYGTAFIVNFGGDRGQYMMSYNTEKAYVQDGKNGSTKLTSIADNFNAWSLKLCGFNKITSDDLGKAYSLWVYNANDFDLIFYGGENGNTYVKANSSALVRIQISATGRQYEGAYGAFTTMVKKADSSNFSKNDCFYLGTLTEGFTPAIPEDNSVVAGLESEADVLAKLGGYTPAHLAGNFSFTYVADVTAGESGIPAAPNGKKGFVKMTPKADGKAQLFTIQLDRQDISAYNYIGMWVYNSNDQIVRLFDTGVSGTTPSNTFDIAPHSWAYWAWNLRDINDSTKIGGASGKLYEKTAVTEIGLTVEGLNLTTKSIYFGSLVGGNYESDAAEFDKEYGSAFITAFGSEKGSVNLAYNTDEAYKEAGAKGSTKFTFTVEKDSFNAKICGISAKLNGKTVQLWVYNPNSYAIKITDGSNTTTIEAGKSGWVTLTVSTTGRKGEGAYGVWSTNVSNAEGGKLAVGDGVYFGSMKVVEENA